MSSPVRHVLLVCSAFTLLFGWLYANPLIEGSFLAESDIYEQFLPVFLSPITTWSSYEFGGVPAFADPQDTAFYPVHFLFARIVGSWTGFIVAAYVMAACFTYAYVYSLTRSRAAAAFAGLAFGLSEAMMERIAHVTTIHAVAWMPLMLLAIDRVRGRRPGIWVVIGAAAIGSIILGGHPQAVLYIIYACALYALAGGLVERADWRYYLRLAAACALGVALTAIKAIPLAETTALTARQGLDFGAFVSHANTPAQMLSMLFPAIVHEGREAPTYVGLATLVLALAAVGRLFRNWRVAFWLAIAVVALLIGVGDATPVAQLAYHVPLYDRFRVSARHLILASFGLTVLAGFGLAALRRGEVSHRALYSAIGLVVGALVAGAITLAGWPSSFELDADLRVWWTLAVGIATMVVCGFLARAPRSQAILVALILLVASDLLLALPYAIGPTGVDATRIPGYAIRPSVHAAKLADELTPGHQRLLAPGGTQLDAVLPAAFARVWQIPIAGGYGPMLLGRHAALAMMGTNGSVDPLLLAHDNAALDLLAVRYVVMRDEELAPSATIERHGLTWASRAMNVPVGPAECGQRHPRTVTYALPPGVEVASVALVAHLRCSEDVTQGTEVARLRLTGAGGAIFERPLLAGVDVAETGLRDATLQRRAKHTTGQIFDPAESSLSYWFRADLPAPLRATRMQIDVNTAGWLELSRLTVIDSSDRSVPLEMPGLLLDSGRWREARRFSTSRVSDRGVDETTPAEQAHIVFENLRAQPRAWIAQEVIPLAEKEMLAAVHHSRLPDGRPLDVAHTALVYPGTMPATRYPQGPAAAVVRTVRDGAFTIDVTTTGGGFLVLSESFYPGWRARIGDRILPVYPSDVSLQGVAVPAGQQIVEFELVSNTLRAGAVLSGVALLILLCVGGWYGVRAGRSAPQSEGVHDAT